MGVSSIVFDIPCFRVGGGPYGLHPLLDQQGWDVFLKDAASRHNAMLGPQMMTTPVYPSILLRLPSGMDGQRQSARMGPLLESGRRGLVAFAGAVLKHFPQVEGARWLLNIYLGPVVNAEDTKRLIESIEVALGEAVMVTWVFDSIGGTKTIGVETMILLGWLMARRKAKNTHRVIGYEPGPWSTLTQELLLGPCCITDHNWSQLPAELKAMPKSVMMLVTGNTQTSESRIKTTAAMLDLARGDRRIAIAVHNDDADADLVKRLISI